MIELTDDLAEARQLTYRATADLKRRADLHQRHSDAVLSKCRELLAGSRTAYLRMEHVEVLRRLAMALTDVREANLQAAREVRDLLQQHSNLLAQRARKQARNTTTTTEEPR